MNLQETEKIAQDIQRLLKVRYVQLPLAMTDKGPLTMKFIKDTEGYEIVLDSVPLDMKEYNNRELKSVLEKYLYGSNTN